MFLAALFPVVALLWLGTEAGRDNSYAVAISAPNTIGTMVWWFSVAVAIDEKKRITNKLREGSGITRITRVTGYKL